MFLWLKKNKNLKMTSIAKSIHLKCVSKMLHQQRDTYGTGLVTVSLKATLGFPITQGQLYSLSILYNTNQNLFIDCSLIVQRSWMVGWRFWHCIVFLLGNKSDQGESNYIIRRIWAEIDPFFYIQHSMFFLHPSTLWFKLLKKINP